ncbi:hypothetical protein MMC10_003178 [Thelotrema lepadinum]|nr:hypothetical protein [Thelotrema lepadinum]
MERIALSNRKSGRLVRLIPHAQAQVHALLNHRLSSSSTPALADWQGIVDGTSLLWAPIPSPTRELLRSMLNHVNFEILKRARPPHSTFNFSSASIGNLFLTGARLFTGSFESAIHLLGLICSISEHVSVIPAINSNFSHHISAGLSNGAVIVGQNAISHPSAPTALPDLEAPSFRSEAPQQQNSATSGGGGPIIHLDDSAAHHPEDANLPGSLPTLRQPNITFSKAAEEDLPARIERIWYINPYGQEIAPFANPKAVSAIRDAEAVIYSIGSLYTSIVPTLILRGVGEAIASSNSNGGALRHKILILNGSVDRETGPRKEPMGATEFVGAIARAGEESRGFRGPVVGRQVWRRYVSHVIYLEGEGVPKVDRKELAEAGVECVRCWGRRAEDGSWRYDGTGLVGALEAILGRGDKGGEKSRRNTMESSLR